MRAGVPVAVADIDDAAVAKRDRSCETRIAQSQRHIVAPREMFVDQRLQVDVGQNITAVDNERLATQRSFRVLDPATRLEEIGLVEQFHRRAGVCPVCEFALELLLQAMRVDDERLDPNAPQMIEREGDERLLKDRHERLRPKLRHRAQP